ncbi:MAG TPA: hypothetical protein VHM30_06935, partial [Gemmatimonadaceae bacterium]|nr:hypothetical protein [Gemmatimonadaceae bacterium]
MSRRACLLVLALATGCAGDRERREPADTTLRSGDRVTIYDAGVEAYRAKDFARARALWQRAAERGET